MARYKSEKEVQAEYQSQRRSIIEALGGLPFIFDRDAMAWDVVRYMGEHEVDLETAITKVADAAAKVGRQYHEELADHREHQHVWIRTGLSVTPGMWHCRSCPARGQWFGDDNTPMQEITNPS